jgi:hypothetical protein
VRDLVRAAADLPCIARRRRTGLDCFPTGAFQRAMNHVLATHGGGLAPRPDRRDACFRAALAHRFGGGQAPGLAGAQQARPLARCLIDPATR